MNGRDQFRRGLGISSVRSTAPSSFSWVKDLPESIHGGIVVSSEDKLYFVSDKLYALNPDGTNYVEPVTRPGFPVGSPAIDERNGYVYFAFISDPSTAYSPLSVIRYDRLLANPTTVFQNTVFYGRVAPLIVTENGTILVTYYKDSSVGSMLAAIGSNSWNIPLCYMETEAPAVFGNFVYSFCDSNWVAVGSIKWIDLATGAILQSTPNGNRGWKGPMLDNTGHPLAGNMEFGGATYFGSYGKWGWNLGWHFSLEEPSYAYTTSRAALMPDGTSSVRLGYRDQQDASLRYVGAEKWGIDTHDPNGLEIFNSAPTVDMEGKILVGKGHKVVCISSITHTIIWESPDLGGMVNDQPIIGHNGAIYVAASNNRIAAISGCSDGLHSAAYCDTALIPRDGPNGPIGEGANSPLNRRTPLILIHGIHGNAWGGGDSVDLPNWWYFTTLIRFLHIHGSSGRGRSDVENRFKLYSFHYVSDRYTASEISKALRDRIDENPEFAGQRVVIVAHSMGGLVARHYMLQPTTPGAYPGSPSGERVEKLITLATPHLGTYGANRDARSKRFFRGLNAMNRYLFAMGLFRLVDSSYWGDAGCPECASDPQHPNRVSLLWRNTTGVEPHMDIDQSPDEFPWDWPHTGTYNRKIVAYYGGINPTGQEWIQLKSDVYLTGILGLIPTLIVGDPNRSLAGGAYLLDSIRDGQFEDDHIPDPRNDGLVPFESAKFDGATLMKPAIYCPGYNHLRMEIGDIMPCMDGKMLFKSVADELMDGSGPSSTPALLTAQNNVGFGSQIFGTARRTGSLTAGPLNVRLSNLGDSPLTVTSLSLIGEDADEFHFVNSPSVPFVIAAAGSANIPVAFNPTSAGPKTAQLRAENDSANPVVTVNISATGVPASCDVTFSTSGQFIPAGGGSGQLPVGPIDCSWDVVSTDDWIHVDRTGDEVTFSIEPNASQDVRNGSIIVRVQGIAYPYTITQDGLTASCWISLSSDWASIPKEGGSTSFYITAPDQCNLTFQSDSSWLIPDQTEGQGSRTIRVTASTNFGSQRDGVISVQTDSASAEFSVHQSQGRQRPVDFDGDGKSDLGVYRPVGANGSEWWVSNSSDDGGFAVQFGEASDKVVASDYTGDGKADIAFWRPSTGEWYVLRSEDMTYYAAPFGADGDFPMPADFDGDSKTDFAVFRPSTSTWFINKSSGGTTIRNFGSAGDRPVAADYDGDGNADIAVFRENGVNGAEWWIEKSSDSSVFATQFGSPADQPVPADYTGDGKADVAFWSPTTGYWYVLRSEDMTYFAAPFGASGDIPVPGDYDGDGTGDFGVFRPADTMWYINSTTTGVLIKQFGASGDIPVSQAFFR